MYVLPYPHKPIRGVTRIVTEHPVPPWRRPSRHPNRPVRIGGMAVVPAVTA